jgi:hypothetical protein
MLFEPQLKKFKCLLKIKERFQINLKRHVLTKIFKTIPLSGGSKLVIQSL